MNKIKEITVNIKTNDLNILYMYIPPERRNERKKYSKFSEQEKDPIKWFQSLIETLER